MKNKILSTNIFQKDKTLSLASIKRLRPYLFNNNYSLVFFIGAGISATGKRPHMPSTSNLIQKILLDALKRSKELNTKVNGLENTIKEISSSIGFEITLNDFWQICREATTLIYSSLAKIEKRCISNQVHAFLAYWLSKGGVVLTTNWDCLIEREWQKIDKNIKVRYQEDGHNSFLNWQNDLLQGGCLFKIHGSLEDPKSCLGALEHVRTRLKGQRADLLTDILKHKPLCFVGWSGKDPDIPPLLYDIYEQRDLSLPTFWVHYEGDKPGTISLKTATNKVSSLIRKYARENPILAEANHAFGEILNWMGKKVSIKSFVKEVRLDFSDAIKQCYESGITRFIGIVLRRAGRLDLAEWVLKIAIKVAQTAEERSAAIQEISLLQQQKMGQNTYKSIKLLEEAHKTLGGKQDLLLQLNLNFGMLSMIITGLKYRPWLLFKLPNLFHKYRKNIEILNKEKRDSGSVALHKALISLYLGRLRLKLFSWIAKRLPFLTNWIIKPFNFAYSIIYSAEDIHIHSLIDVLAYRVVALARLKRCKNIRDDIHEIDRLISIFNDDARTRHWKNQKKDIMKNCFKIF